jgi:cytochrome P450
MKLASGRPFRADRDVYYAALDFIFAATFGLDYKTSATEAQKRFLLSKPGIKIPDSIDEAVQFPVSDRPRAIEAIVTLNESMEAPMKSPIPRLHHALLRQLPYMRKAREEKEDLITAEIEKRISRFESGDTTKLSALDDILQRELNTAKKEGRTPNLKSRAIYDELLGFLMGGHDTTSATIAWAVKHLAWTPNAQSALRTSLRNAYGDAARERRNPTLREITHTSVPYLDAAIEEIHRVALVLPGTVRDAMTDTMVLGHHIPKGTRVFLLQTGPGFFSEAFDIPDRIRSKSAIEAKYQIGLWDPLSTGEFKPERWLTKDEQGNEVYNSMAGPHLAFGLGPRACYGRRLAYLELRISLALLVWNFEFLPCPDELSSWDAIQKITRAPRVCYIRLKKAEW